MNPSVRHSRTLAPGVSLVETMVAVGVLAVMIPVALAAIQQAGAVGHVAGAQSRAPSIADHCLLELEAALCGASELLPAGGGDGTWPTGGVVLAFDQTGHCLGRVDEASYEAGMSSRSGDRPVFLARVGTDRDPTGLAVAVSVEHPAVRAARLRERFVFHTRLP